MGDEVLGITNNNYDLVNAYQFEHYEVINPQYEYLSNHTIFRLDTHHSLTYLCAVTLKQQ